MPPGRKAVAIVATVAIAAAIVAGAFAYVTFTKPKVSYVAFVPTGVVIDLDREASVKSVEISGSASVKVDVNRQTSRVYVPFDWSPGHTYTVKVDLGFPYGEATYSRRARDSPELYPIATVTLLSNDEVADDIPWIGKGYDALGGDLAWSPDGSMVAVVQHDGTVRVFDSYGNKLWEKPGAPDAVGISIAFSKDGKYLLVGERSVRDGYVYCLRADTGEEVWKYRTADDIGEGDPGWKLYYCPTVYDIKTAAANGKQLAFACASIYDKSKSPYKSRFAIYCFDIEAGGRLWIYGPIERSYGGARTYKVCVSDDGGYVAFGCGWGKQPWVIALNGSSGAELWRYEVDPVIDPSTGSSWYSSFWKGVAISPDGKYVAAMPSDGRIFVIDNLASISAGKPVFLWNASVGTPIWIETASGSKIPVYAYGNKAMVTKDGKLLVLIGQSFAVSAWAGYGVKPPALHQNATSLFVFNLTSGKLMWKYQYGAYPTKCGLSADHRWLAVATDHDWMTRDTSYQGAYIFDLRESKALEACKYSYNTEGVCLAAALSSDGSRLAVLEGPLNVAESETDPAVIAGGYRLHIFIM